MKDELIEKYNDCSLSFYVNIDASGIENEDGDLSADDDFPHVDYQIKDGTLLSWDGSDVMDLDELDDSWWERAMNPDEDDIEDGIEPKTEFDCFVSEIMNQVIQNDYIGCSEFEELIDDRRILLILLKDEDDTIIEEIEEWDIAEHVD